MHRGLADISNHLQSCTQCSELRLSSADQRLPPSAASECYVAEGIAWSYQHLMEGNDDDDLYGDLLTGQAEEGQGHYRAEAEEVCRLVVYSCVPENHKLRRLPGRH